MSPGEKWKLLGRSPRIRSILEDLERVLPRLEPGRRVPTILLQGETGTGKGLLARTIHEASLYEHAMVLVQLGEAQLETCPAEADRRATQALELARRHGERGSEAWARYLQSRVAVVGPTVRVDTAFAHAGEALTLADQLGLRPLVAHCHLGLGRLYRCAGQSREAQEHVRSATSMYGEMDMRAWLEQAEAEAKDSGA